MEPGFAAFRRYREKPLGFAHARRDLLGKNSGGLLKTWGRRSNSQAHASGYYAAQSLAKNDMELNMMELWLYFLNFFGRVGAQVSKLFGEFRYY